VSCRTISNLGSPAALAPLVTNELDLAGATIELESSASQEPESANTSPIIKSGLIMSNQNPQTGSYLVDDLDPLFSRLDLSSPQEHLSLPQVHPSLSSDYSSPILYQKEALMDYGEPLQQATDFVLTIVSSATGPLTPRTAPSLCWCYLSSSCCRYKKVEFWKCKGCFMLNPFTLASDRCSYCEHDLKDADDHFRGNMTPSKSSIFDLPNSSWFFLGGD
jgi:hypothetical protein